MRRYLLQNGLQEESVFFLFSAHGLPKTFVEQGDLYAYECEISYQAVMQGFPKAEGILCYQSKFGPGEWLRPYTEEVCRSITHYHKGRAACIFVPISFTSDHIETLFEVEEQYMPLIAQQGLLSLRTPALNRQPEWLDAITKILCAFTPCPTAMLIRN